MRPWIGICVLLLLIGLGSWIRIGTALRDPGFDRENPVGLLRSDPGLLYYLVERVVESGGLPPADFRADPRVEYPDLADLPAMFSVGQEFFVAWCYLLFGGGIPLHVFCVWIMGIFASLSIAGVYGLSMELSGSVKWASLAAVLFTLLPANYRTIGFVLIREDFSLPFFSLHLYLLARAVRLETRMSILLCALTLVASLATWHATRFLVSLEALCLFLWFLRTGRSVFQARHAWLLPAIVGASSVLIPVLWRTGLLFSLPMQMMLALLVVASARRRGERRRGRLAGTALLVCLGSGVLAWGIRSLLGVEGYSHVLELAAAKVLHLGRLPADPRQLSFEARLMWQGPFASLDLTTLHRMTAAALWLTVLATPAAAIGWLRGPGERHVAFGLALLGLIGAWLIQRLVVLPGLLCPVVAVTFLGRLARRGIATAAIGLALPGQAFFFASLLEAHRIPWYRPAEIRGEIRDLLHALPRLVPAGVAIAADPILSTALLVHARHAAVLQPKWETRESRRRIEEFLMTFHHQSPAELRQLLVGRYRCRYVVFDRRTLGGLFRYSAGFPRLPEDPRSYPEPGSAAAVFLSDRSAVLRSVPGFQLLYRSPVDWLRLYRIDP